MKKNHGSFQTFNVRKFFFFLLFSSFLSILVNLFCKLILIWKMVWGALTERTKVKGLLVCLIPLQLHFLFAAIWLEGLQLIHAVWPVWPVQLGQPVRASPSALQGSPLLRVLNEVQRDHMADMRDGVYRTLPRTEHPEPEESEESSRLHESRPLSGGF